MFLKNITKEKNINKAQLRDRINILLLNPGEKYNQLYSNFDIKDGITDFMEGIDKKIKIPTYALDTIHQKVGFKNYQIISDDDNISNIQNKRNSPKKMKYDDNNNKDSSFHNFIIKNNNKKSLKNNNYYINLNKNNIYDRLYNYGFYIKNKISIKKIRSEENFYKEMQKPKINLKSRNYILQRNNVRINKTFNDFQIEETFKPKINENSIRIVNKLKKEKKKKSKENKKYLNYSFNIDNNKNNISRNDLSNEYINLFNYNNNLKKKKNKNYRKTNSQRLINLYEKGLEHYKKIENEYNLKKEKDYKENYKTFKNNNDDFIIQYKNSNKMSNLYEKNIKWKNEIKEKINKKREKEMTKEMEEINKTMDLPGKKSYYKFKNDIDLIYAPKIKINSYALLKKKKNT